MATDIRDLLAQAIFDRLNDDAAFMTLITNRLFDEPAPNATVYPNVTIGQIDLSDWSSHTHDGFDGDFTINTWTQYDGKKEVHEIMARVYTLLHNFDPALTGFPTVNFRQSSSSGVLDQDGRTYNGIQIFNVMFGGNST